MSLTQRRRLTRLDELLQRVFEPNNTISGNFTKIVVVRVNTGYAPDPMSMGTGTIVATFCP